MANIDISAVKGFSDEDEDLIENEWDLVDKGLFGKDYDRFDFERKYFKFRAEIDGNFAGILRGEMEGGVAIIDEVLVFSQFRFQGVGTQLMEMAEKFAREHNCHKISLETDRELEAMTMYLEQGYSEETVLKKHYGNHDAIVMSKFINKID